MTETVEVPPEVNKPGVSELARQSTRLAESYANYSIINQAEYLDGAEQLKDIKAQQKRVNEERVAITRPMDEAKGRVMTFFRQFTDRLASAEDSVKAAMTHYSDAQERIAAEAARIEQERAEKEAKRLREEARRADAIAAEKERKRLAEEQRKADEKAEIERKRIQEEHDKAKTEGDRLRAAEQAKAERRRRDQEQERIHQERLSAEADKRERTARAETLEQRADDTTAAPLKPAVAKVAGISKRKKWCFEITDKSLIPDQYKTIDEKKIRGVVNALKGDADIPGVRVYAESVIAAGSK